jgi:hypothetical protein
MTRNFCSRSLGQTYPLGMKLFAERWPNAGTIRDVSRFRGQPINHFINSDFCVCHRLSESFILKLIVADPNEAEVVQTDEPENSFKVRLKKVEVGKCSARVK